MNKYTELSDFEINKKVASSYLECDYTIDEQSSLVELVSFLGDTAEYSVYGKFDPCNNPSDAMPIIIENKIAMNPKDDIWQCGSGWNVAENKNPLRAAMELFLLIKDAENENNNNC